jgi:transcriptional repressor NrdR
VHNSIEKEIASDAIGEMVLKRLRDVDQVAYVRFASVYRDFAEISEFSEEVQQLLRQPHNS